MGDEAGAVTVTPAEGSAHPESPPVVADGGSSSHASGDQGIPLSSGGWEQALHDNATSRDESCAICFEEPPLDPCRTTCSHVFCSACLLQAFKTDGMWNRGKCPLCRERISIYSTTMVATGEPLGVPEVTTIFGSAYLQGGSAGVASYHFDAPDDAYISYEKAPAEWKFDDGSPPPARKPFVNPHYDDATRTFTGTVLWSDAAFAGDARWEYRMVFSDNFAVIAEGEIRCFDAAGRETRTNVYPSRLHYWRQTAPVRSIFGRSYIQDGSLGLASYHFPASGPDGAYISYEAAPPHWKLDDGSRLPRQKLFEVCGPAAGTRFQRCRSGASPRNFSKNPRYDEETRTFTGTVRWAESTFDGDARWEYRMQFAEDFEAISGGEVKAFDGADSPTETSLFGLHLVYRLYVEEMFQMMYLLRDLAADRQHQN